MKKKVVGAIGVFVALGIALSCVGLAFPIETAFWILVGWAPFLDRTLPRVTVDWMGVATAAVAFIVFAAGMHSLCGWLWRQSHAAGGGDNLTANAKPAWRRKWTAAIVLVVILMFSAGIGAVGIAHQVGWLLTAREPWVDTYFEAAARTQSKNNLKQFGLAFHNYHDEHAVFPPGGTFDATGTALHSWETALLPFIELSALHSKIDLNTPWNDPRNAEHFKTSLPIFVNLAVARRRRYERTEFDPDGYALSHYAVNGWVLSGNRALSFGGFTDGTSNTILAGEVNANFKPWGDPRNWRDPAKGINKAPDGFGSPFTGGANFLMADGTVRFSQERADPEVFKALSTPSGGEEVPNF
jgi:hypothetical protein